MTTSHFSGSISGPALGTHFIGTIGQMDMQGLYAQMFARGLSARTIEYTNGCLNRPSVRQSAGECSARIPAPTSTRRE